MIEKKLNTIIRLGMWIAVLTGSTFGLVLTIAGYLADWGPGGDMEGPLWRILLVGSLSFIMAAFIGVFLFKFLARKILHKVLPALEMAIRSFAAELIASMAAWLMGWEVGYLMGKITGTIEGLDWMAVLIYTPLMSFIFGIPFSLAAASTLGMFAFLYLKFSRNQENIE